MAFSNYVPPLLNKEQSGAMPDILSKILGGYNQVQKSAYLPRQLEANIFNQEISPLAALASSPNFTGFNPDIQKMIAQRIGSYLHGNTGSKDTNQFGEPSGTAGYASDEDIYERLSHGAHETFGPGKRSSVGRAKLLNLGEQFGLPESITKILGGTKASQEQAIYDQSLEEGIQRLKMKGYSDSSARQLLERIPGENDKTYAKRIKSLFVNSSSPNEDEAITNIDKKIDKDNQERADAQATAKAFNTTPEIVLEALSMGVKTAKEFKEFLKWREQ